MKKILSLLLVLTLVFALSACSKNNTSSDINTGVSSTQMENESNTAGDDTSDTTTTENDNNSGADSTVKEESKPSSTENSKPVESSKPTNSTSTPSNSKPDETSKPTTSTSTPQNELVKIRIDTDVSTKGLSGFDGADCITLFINLRENEDGSFKCNYAIHSWKQVNLTSASKVEQETLLNSVKVYEEFYDYPDIYSGVYWGWVSLGYGDSYPTFNDLKQAIGIGWDKNADTEYFPSEMFGKRYVYISEDINCSYDKETGKLTLDDKFPFKDFYIKNDQNFKINGTQYGIQDIIGYDIR